MNKRVRERIRTAAKQPSPTTTYAPVEMNAYVRPDVRKLYYNVDQYILNGENNKYWNYIEDRYYGSTTNSAAIDGICGYIYGDGLIDSNGNSLKNIISNDDLRMLIQDYKMFGQAYLFVVYDYNRKVAKLEWVSTKKIGVFNDGDILTKPDYYWYCFDWRDRFKFTPQLIPSFEKEYGLNELFSPEELKANPYPSVEDIKERKPKREILCIRRPSSEPYFSQPDYVAGMQYAEWEEELSNTIINGIKNDFAPKYLVNVYGVEESYEAQKKMYDSFQKNWTGSDKNSTFAIVFNDNNTQASNIELVPDDDKNKKYVSTGEKAKTEILLSHRYYPILLGIDKATGFSNNADEMNQALRLLYRNVINVIREQILDSLENVLKVNSPDIQLKFKDFKELDTEDNNSQIISE